MTETKYVHTLDKDQDNAVLLLEAAEKLKLDADVVRTTSDGFLVPQEVADKAGVEYDSDDDDESDDQELSFSTKAEAQEYAEAHSLDVDTSLKADEYKAAVVAAANKEN